MSMLRPIFKPIGVAFCGCFLFASIAQASSQESVLGGAGELFTVRSGAYEELFPGQSGAAPENPVLSLVVTLPDSTSTRLLVPGTEGAEVESAPFLLYEEDSRSLFLVWASRINSIHSTLRLASYNGTSWTETIEIIGNLFSFKTEPRLAITRDTYRLPRSNGEDILRHRTILHLIWNEDGNSKQATTLYSPVILEEGAYVGWNPIFNLLDFIPSEAAVTDFEPAVALVQSPTIESGRDGRTVVAAFISTNSRQLVTLGIEVLPRELLSLADIARGIIINIGRKLSYPANASRIAQEVHAAVIKEGDAFHPEVISSIADQVATQIVTARAGESSLLSVADGARGIIINIGRKLSGGGLKNPNVSLIRDFLIEVPENVESPEPTRQHAFQIQVLSARPAPRVGQGAVQVFMSERGTDVLIAWAAEDRVFYRETAGQGWSPIKELRLSSELTQDRAYQVLEQRVRNR
jgi:hypothetical protein